LKSLAAKGMGTNKATGSENRKHHKEQNGHGNIHGIMAVLFGRPDTE
jgi:hypothetical protein